MKFIKYITVLSVFLSGIVACTDYVDYDPIENYEITADVYFQAPDSSLR